VQALALHPWRVSFHEAVAIQESLRERLALQPLDRPVRLIAGADVAYARSTHCMYAAVVVVRLPELDVVERCGVRRAATFPYIPGLLSFREIPALAAAFARLSSRPDLLMFDAQGFAHPRRFGLACHAGVLFGTPSIGCAKTRLIGEHAAVARSRGSVAPLIDRGDEIGAVVRTREGVKPVYVSPGHLVDIPSAIELVMRSTGRFRLPEPVRLAHQETVALRRRDADRPAAPVRRYRGFIKER